MSKFGHKIKAFTLSEMIIVLLITVIVVGLAFSVLNLVQKQMGGMSENYQHNTRLNLLQQALWIDFGTYANINYDQNSNVLRFTNELKYIDYIFENEWIIREKDTFHLKLANRQFYFDGTETTTGSVDAIKLITMPEKGDKTLFIHNENAAAEYMY